jgi:Ala-tRNA(Pro) deacylase
MSIPTRLLQYLDQHRVSYAVCDHPHSHSSAETARAAHVPPHQLVKSVIVEDDAGCVAALVPADCSVSLRGLSRVLGREHMRLADESRVAELFADCERGAVPALGMAWNVETVVDDALEGVDEVYVEAGDHERLLRIPHDAFHALMSTARHGQFCAERLH